MAFHSGGNRMTLAEQQRMSALLELIRRDSGETAEPVNLARPMTKTRLKMRLVTFDSRPRSDAKDTADVD
jgi:hypothetical protein